MTALLIVGIVGLVVSVLSVLLDGILDVVNLDFAGNGLFSTSTLGGLLAGFGFGGFFVGNAGATYGVALAAGAAIGLAAAALTAGISIWLKRAEATETSQSMDQILGTVGTAAYGANPGHNGTILISYLGSDTKLNFTADVPIADGQPVVVTGIISSNLVRVRPFIG